MPGEGVTSVRLGAPGESVEMGVDPGATCIEAGIQSIAAIFDTGVRVGMAMDRAASDEQEGGEQQGERAHGGISVGVC